MTRQGAKFSSLSVGVLSVAVFLSSLAFLPKIFHRTSFEFEPKVASESVEQLERFPLDRRFTVLQSHRNSTAITNRKPGSPHSSVTLRDILNDRGSLLVNFWATWCPPCIEELPSLEYLDRQIHGQGKTSLPQLVTISVDEGPFAISELFKTLDFAVQLIVLHDPNGLFSRSLGTVRFPETYWVDREGRILHKWIGPQNWLSQDIIQILMTAM